MVAAIDKTSFKGVINVNENGTVFLPSELCDLLLKHSGIRSRKKRHVKKAIAKQFNKLLLEYHEQIKNTSDRTGQIEREDQAAGQTDQTFKTGNSESPQESK